MPVRRLLSWVLALVLCLQSGLALAHCLRMGNPAGHQPFPVEICTAEGLVKIDLGDAQDGEGERQGAPAAFCLACHGLPQITLPAPTDVAAPLVAFTARPPSAAADAAPLGARAPPYRPTGPPRFS
ncbi:hypothetical protein KTR66_20190 [Roseococcus sp. SDR]|uniref:DUF2946 family protein n=1 Tax=Roseococcus sp. SDR TaxID=2835532 RepID=UPI001BCD5B0D|nr:DUF2946 family protein [Roseococcus sp. SDR]MBS7792323.1 hypothetical protein [Roseococcus sp. SDR]MBV1847637.1 hypothetical protein [Roseococcus sp. SDR]